MEIGQASNFKVLSIDVHEGQTIRSIARDHRIPSSNLRGHFYGTTIQRKGDKRAILIDEEENELVDYLLKMKNL